MIKISLLSLTAISLFSISTHARMPAQATYKNAKVMCKGMSDSFLISDNKKCYTYDELKMMSVKECGGSLVKFYPIDKCSQSSNLSFSHSNSRLRAVERAYVTLRVVGKSNDGAKGNYKQIYHQVKKEAYKACNSIGTSYQRDSKYYSVQVANKSQTGLIDLKLKSEVVIPSYRWLPMGSRSQNFRHIFNFSVTCGKSNMRPVPMR